MSAKILNFHPNNWSELWSLKLLVVNLKNLIFQIRDFLQHRKYTVVANGVISIEQDVISGIPQGTVLASLFFIIIIADIDDNLMNSIVRLFADDTKISAKIKRI